MSTLSPDTVQARSGCAVFGGHGTERKIAASIIGDPDPQQTVEEQEAVPAYEPGLLSSGVVHKALQ
jgi:hypothetical protein